MATFKYKAKRKNAETVVGQVIADSREEAIEKIHQLGLTPISLEGGLLSGRQRRGGAKKVSVKALYLFSRQLVNLLKSGIAILRALDIIASQTRDVYLRSVINNIHFSIREGKSFSDSVREYPHIFSGLYVAMIQAGEESGNLKETVADMAEYLRRQQELLTKVRNAMMYPLLMALFGIGTLVFILTYVMPQLTGMFVDLDQSLPVPTIIVMHISGLLINWWPWIIAIILAGGVAVSRWAKSQSGRIMKSKIKLKMPFLGDFWLKVEMARFCGTLELLLKSGISIVRAIQLSIPVVDNELIQDQLIKCRKELVAGCSFGASIKQQSLIPGVMGDLIIVGEESGSIGETLHNISEDYEQDINETIKVMTTLLEPLMIIVVGSVIGFVVIAMLLPIFQLDVFV